MKVQVDINIGKVAGSKLDDKAKLFLANTAYKLMDDYVPMDTGTLAQTVDITPEHIHYKVPYAQRLFYGEGMNFSKDKHPLATAGWDKAMLSARKSKLSQTMQGYFKKGGE